MPSNSGGFDPVAARAADEVIRCRDFDAELAAYTEERGFRLELIFPADAPRLAVVSKNGTRVRLEAAEPAPDSPAPAALTIQRHDDAWGSGRAGMQYRDLMPGRFGGRCIASHIRIPQGGPVPDYVHHHHVRFQMIYCYRGWVKVVYEDQGPPFVMHAGDCVLQPPHIRHRVLECSDMMEVIEVGCPAEHETLVDHELELPTATENTRRDFDGQRFVYHRAAEAAFGNSPYPGFAARDLGIEKATRGLASVDVLRPQDDDADTELGHDADLLFLFVLEGSAGLAKPDGQIMTLDTADALTLPPSESLRLRARTEDFEALRVLIRAG